MKRAIHSIVFACLMALPSFSRAAEDPMNRLVTRSGVTLRTDERLFTLYAAFNALGYDEAPIARDRPFTARRFSLIRQKVRANFRLAPDSIQRFEALFERAPLSIEAYVRCALSLDSAFADSTHACDEALAELPGLLEKVRAPALYAEVAAEARELLRPLLPKLDTAIGSRSEQSALIVLFNALDGQRTIVIDQRELLALGDFEGEALVAEIVRHIERAAEGREKMNQRQSVERTPLRGPP
ncbi:MAG: hypothetical protein LBM75_10335 [Myxococcales bacterium]|jgi:hypothetical protein|nr:hypothetical protein [Myxococcales bacterium]